MEISDQKNGEELDDFPPDVRNCKLMRMKNLEAKSVRKTARRKEGVATMLSSKENLRLPDLENGGWCLSRMA